MTNVTVGLLRNIAPCSPFLMMTNFGPSAEDACIAGPDEVHLAR